MFFNTSFFLFCEFSRREEIVLLEEVHTRVLDVKYDFAIEIYDDWRE